MNMKHLAPGTSLGSQMFYNIKGTYRMIGITTWNMAQEGKKYKKAKQQKDFTLLTCTLKMEVKDISSRKEAIEINSPTSLILPDVDLYARTTLQIYFKHDLAVTSNLFGLIPKSILEILQTSNHVLEISRYTEILSQMDGFPVKLRWNLNMYSK